MSAARIVARAVALLGAAFAVGAAVPLGCRQALGIESLGSDAVTCDNYCTQIADNCSGADLQYGSTALCMGVCATFPVGTLADMSGNSLGCRINTIAAIKGAEGSCSAAGPTGYDADGSVQCADTLCASFCYSALQVCPKDYGGSMSECLSDCEALKACSQPFSVPTDTCIPDYGSVQCRYYHLAAATIDPTEHCPHVEGIGYCSESRPACPNDDACYFDAGKGDGG